MTAVDPNILDTKDREVRRAVWFTRINKADKWFTVLGLSWITPILKAIAGDNPKAQVSEIWRLLIVPLLAIAAFLVLWGTLAPKVRSTLTKRSWVRGRGDSSPVIAALMEAPMAGSM